MKRLGSYGFGSPRVVVWVRLGVGVWLLALGAFLCFSGTWWGVLFLAPAALHFYLAYRAALSRGGLDPRQKS
jgi:hypothetical protein